MFEGKSRLWVIHIANDEKSAERAQTEGFICLGWNSIGDLSPYNTREKMKAAYRKAHPDESEGTIRASYGQVFRFAHEMEQGDPIVYPIKNSRDIMIGEIAGPYRWASDDKQLAEVHYRNVRKVKWLKRVPRIAFSQDALHSFGSIASLSTSDDYLEEVIAILNREGPVPAHEKQPAQPVAELAPSADTTRINLAERASEETQDYLLRQWSRTAQEFEHVVAAVIRAMNYTAHVGQGTHDLGVDVIAHTDPLGVHPPLLKIQAKSGTGKIGAKDVKELRGLLNQGEKGILVALGGFSNDAKHVQQNDADIVLIDGERFVELFLKFYDRLEPEMRIKFPLKQVFVYAG